MPPVTQNTPRRAHDVLVLTALSAFTRFWGLFHPRTVVFDERHFEADAGAYFTGRFYFDVHPPLGKLLIAGAARVLGVPASALVNLEPAVAVRVLPALAGTLLVPLVWLLLRQLRAGRTVAALGAALVLLDNGLLVQSRFILLDTLLMAFGLGAATVYLAGRARGGPARLALFATASLCAGLSASVKWTGLAALGLILLAWLVELVATRPPWSRAAAEAIVLLAPAVAAYVASFAIHFALLHRSGPGDSWMPAAFQATLQGSPRYDPARRMSFGAAFLALHHAMAHAQDLLRTATHEYASPWYAWPFLVRPIHLWRSDLLPGGRVENIHLLGNPVVWLGALTGTAVTAVGWARRRESFAAHRAPLAFLAAGVVLNYLPFVFIHRVLFIYSYFPTLLFAIPLAAYGVGVLAGWTSEPERLFAFPTRRSRVLFWSVAGAALSSFVIVAPISYGLPVKAGGMYEYTPYHVRGEGLGARG